LFFSPVGWKRPHHNRQGHRRRTPALLPNLSILSDRQPWRPPDWRPSPTCRGPRRATGRRAGF